MYLRFEGDTVDSVTPGFAVGVDNSAGAEAACLGDPGGVVVSTAN